MPSAVSSSRACAARSSASVSSCGIVWRRRCRQLVLGHPLPDLAQVVGAIHDAVHLHRRGVGDDARVEDLEHVPVDELRPALGLGRVGRRRRLRHQLLDLSDVDQQLLVGREHLLRRRLQLRHVGAALGHEVLVGDQCVELRHQVGLGRARHRRELRRERRQVGRNLVGLELVERDAFVEQDGAAAAAEPAARAAAAARRRRAEVDDAVALLEADDDFLVHARVDDVRVLVVDREAGAADRRALRRQAHRQARPRLAAVGRLEEAVLAVAVVIGPGAAVVLVGRRDDDVRVARVDDEVADAPVLHRAEVRPGLAAVDRLEQAAFAVHLVVVELAFGGDVDDVGVLGVDGDHRDEEALLQADVRPRLAGVGRLPHPVAVGAGAGVHRLAGAEVQDVGVRRGDGKPAHALGGVFLEDRLEVDAAVDGLPDAAARHEHVVGLALAAGHGVAADASGEGHRPHPAPGELVEVVGRERGLGLLLRVLRIAERPENADRYCQCT